MSELEHFVCIFLNSIDMPDFMSVNAEHLDQLEKCFAKTEKSAFANLWSMNLNEWIQ